MYSVVFLSVSGVVKTMSNQSPEQVCRCPQFHAGPCTKETGRNWPENRFPTLRKIAMWITKREKELIEKRDTK